MDLIEVSDNCGNAADNWLKRCNSAVVTRLRDKRVEKPETTMEPEAT